MGSGVSLLPGKRGMHQTLLELGQGEISSLAQRTGQAEPARAGAQSSPAIPYGMPPADISGMDRRAPLPG